LVTARQHVSAKTLPGGSPAQKQQKKLHTALTVWLHCTTDCYTM